MRTIKKATPMKKDQKQVNPLQHKYLNDVIEQAYREMLKKKGIDPYRPSYGDRENEPARIKQARLAIKQYEAEEQKRTEERWRKHIQPLQRRLNGIKAEILFLEPRQALELVKRFAQEAGLAL